MSPIVPFRISYLPPPTNNTSSSSAPSPSSNNNHDLGTPKTFLGTVRYIGSVRGTTGVWWGVEWDDVGERGKHSGEKDGHKIFDVQVPHSASFIRPPPNLFRPPYSTQPGISLGLPFIPALRCRYLDDDPFSIPNQSGTKNQPVNNNVDHLSFTLSSKVGRDLEALGMDELRKKVSRLTELRTIGLEGEGVSGWNMGDWMDGIGVIGDMMTEGKEMRFPRADYLDLSNNLIPSLEELHLIVTRCPNLRELIVNNNRFLPLPSPSLSPSTSFPSFTTLTTLHLNETLLSWDEMVLILEPWLPDLKKLQLGFNGIERLRIGASSQVHESGNAGGGDESRRQSNSPREHKDKDSEKTGSEGSQRFQKLEELNLEGNLLKDWNEILDQLGGLPKLSRLILSHNPFRPLSQSLPSPQLSESSLPSHDPQSSLSSFPSLTSLSLSPLCGLKSWSDVDVLNRLEKLKAVVLGVGEVVNSNGGGEGGGGVRMEGGTDKKGKEREEKGELEVISSSSDERSLRLSLISRLGKLKSLDNSEIRTGERKDADLWYLSRILEEVGMIEIGFMNDNDGQKSKSKESDVGEDKGRREMVIQEIKRRHPRYEELVKTHGDLDSLPMVKGRVTETTTALKSKLIDVHIQFTPSSLAFLHPLSTTSHSPLSTITLSLLSSSPVRLIRTRISKALGIQPIPKIAGWNLVALLDTGSGGTITEREGKEGGSSLHIKEKQNNDDLAKERIRVPMTDEGKAIDRYGIEKGDWIEVAKIPKGGTKKSGTR